MENLKKTNKLVITNNPRYLLKKTFISHSKQFLVFKGKRIIGLLLFFLIMYLPLHFFKIYNNELDWICKNYYYFFVIGWKLCIDVIVCLYIGFYSIIYRLNHPFFEQYKISVTPWPWEIDPEQYDKDAKKMLKRNFLFTCIYGGFLVTLSHWIGMTQWNYDMKDLPPYYMILIQ